MLQYKVRSGQNIYDVALTLHGSVEGIFDLLLSNDWLSMDTELKYGMTLNYHEEFVINKDITMWFKEKGVLVKNGEHIHTDIDVKGFIERHVRNEHPETYGAILDTSSDEQALFWESLHLPRMMVSQNGQVSEIIASLKPGTHLIVDWGDYSSPLIIEGEEEREIEHCYKSSGRHIITLYGDFEFHSLDLRGLNGVYYALGPIVADSFLSNSNSENLNKLIITK